MPVIIFFLICFFELFGKNKDLNVLNYYHCFSKTNKIMGKCIGSDKVLRSFVAIDFETATESFDSICSVGIVTMYDGIITDEYTALCAPPENEYWYGNINIHGITPEMTLHMKGFYSIYPEIKKRLKGKQVVAHNESFDRNALRKTMKVYGLDYEELELEEKWVCTLRIYRSLGYKPADLNTCCRRNGIELKHHDALSDARGCALLYDYYLTGVQ